MAATRPPFFLSLHLNLRRIVEVVGRGTNNPNIPLSDQLAAGRKEYILAKDLLPHGEWGMGQVVEGIGQLLPNSMEEFGDM